MDKEKLISELKKMFKDKKSTNIIVALLIIAFILIAYNFFSSNNNKNNVTNNYNNANEVTKELEDYEKKQKEDLINILKQIDGIGSVDVMISFEGGEVKVPAYDTTVQNTTTEETDSNGGKRVNNTTNDGSQVVMTNNGSTDEPFILQTIKPKVVSVVVVAEGAADSKIKYDIEVAVSNLYNIGVSKVNVYTMGK